MLSDEMIDKLAQEVAIGNGSGVLVDKAEKAIREALKEERELIADWLDSEQEKVNQYPVGEHNYYSYIAKQLRNNHD